MTKKDKVEAIYRGLPELVNDDVALSIYILNRCGAELSPKQEEAFRRAGNMEHWSRAARLVRAEHPDWVDDKVKEAREEEFVDYKYNAKAHTATTYMNTYISDDGLEYIKL